MAALDTDHASLGRTNQDGMMRNASPQHLRPLPLRATSEADHVSSDTDSGVTEDGRQRSISSYGFSSKPRNAFHPALPSARNSAESSLAADSTPNSAMPTPPVTPIKGGTTETPVPPQDQSNTILFDFSRIDYELDRARIIGSGLWSSVYLAESLRISPPPSSSDCLTPPSTPNRHHATSVSSVVAVKCPARPDAKSVFEHEARILNHLHSAPRVNEHIVAFHGLDPRNSNLVFEGVIGGSLGDLSGRLNVVTELSRHLEVRQLFPGIAKDLIAGLHFLHSMRVVHADIKPANILLDIVDTGRQGPVLRARYIDFSASFLLNEDNSKLNAGATWDFMAPEQLRIQKELNQPTFASDVWGLGITLLYIIVGGSPYKAACGTNLFMLREAIKSGDPLGFARMDPAVDKRLKACQDFVDCCRLALQKDRERRCTAEGWAEWLEQQEFETSGNASSP